MKTLLPILVAAITIVSSAQAALVGQWTFENGSLADSKGNFDPVVLEGDAAVSAGALDVNGSGTDSTGWAHASALPTSSPIQNKTLVSWITLQGLNDVAKHGAAISIDLQSGDRFDGIVFGERDANRWMNGSSGFNRTPPAQFDQAVALETVAPSPAILNLAVSYAGLGGGQVRITGYRNGVQMGQYQIGNFATWAAGEYEILFGPRHTSPNPNGALNALIHEARLYDTVLTQAEIQALVLTVNSDSDNDLLPDQWEMANAGNLTDLNGKGAGPGPGAGSGNFDADGLLDKDELTADTNPKNADTDGDTLTDGAEVKGTAGARPATSPTKADTDGDGLSDFVETNDGSFNSAATDTGTNPTLVDTDLDEFPDGFEVNSLHTNPVSAAEPTFAQALLGHWTFEAGLEKKDLKGNFPDVILEGNATIVNGALNINGASTTPSGWARSGAGGATTLGSKTLVTWMTLEGLENVAKAGAPMSLDSAVSDKFDGIVFAERNVNRWMNGSSNFQRTPVDQFDNVALSEETTTGTRIMLAITYQDLTGGQGQITGYRNGVEMGTYETGFFASWAPGEQEVLFGPRHTSPATNGALDALVHEARLYGKAGSAAEILALFNAGPVLGTDIDQDNLADAWEQGLVGNLTSLNGKGTAAGPGAGTGDFDGDGLRDINELTRGTNPTLADTDGDTLGDNAEILGAGARPPTSPVKADTDGDGLSDLVETNDTTFNGTTDTGTNPIVADTDADGFTDGYEVNTLRTNPLNAAEPGFAGALIGHWTFETGSELKDLKGNFSDLVLEGDATVKDGAVDINGSGVSATGWAHASALPTSPPVSSKTLISWMTLQGLEDVAKAGAPLSIDLQNGDRFDGIVFAERNVNRWMNGSSNFQRTPEEQFDQTALSEETTTGTQIMLAITYKDLGGGQVEITGYRNGAEMGTYTSGFFASWAPGAYEVLMGPRHTSPATNGALDALVHEARLYGKAATAAEIAQLFAAGPVGGELIAVTNITVNRTAGTADMTWVSKPGKKYRMEYSDNLVQWIEATDNYPAGGATGPSTTYRFTNIPAGAGKRFFRATQQ